jgi:hypothetical protein
MIKTLKVMLPIIACAVLTAVPAVAQTNWVTGNANPYEFSSTKYPNSTWTSGYKFQQYPAAEKGTGYFQLGTDASKASPTKGVAWSGKAADGGNFLMADGSTTANTPVWSDTFSTKVVAGHTYALGMSGLALDNDKSMYSNLNFEINGSTAGITYAGGSNAGQLSAANLYNVSSVNDGWKAINGTWTATSTETVTFSIIDKATQQTGNDFGLDDISFKPVPEASTFITFGILCLAAFFTLRKRSSLKASAA